MCFRDDKVSHDYWNAGHHKAVTRILFFSIYLFVGVECSNILFFIDVLLLGLRLFINKYAFDSLLMVKVYCDSKPVSKMYLSRPVNNNNMLQKLTDIQLNETVHQCTSIPFCPVDSFWNNLWYRVHQKINEEEYFLAY